MLRSERGGSFADRLSPDRGKNIRGYRNAKLLPAPRNRCVRDLERLGQLGMRVGELRQGKERVVEFRGTLDKTVEQARRIRLGATDDSGNQPYQVDSYLRHPTSPYAASVFSAALPHV